MKVRMMLATIFTLAITSIGFAQTTEDNNTYNLFQPVPVTMSPSSTQTENFTFGTKQIFLSCPTGEEPFALLTGPNGGGLIADNQITVNGTNVCPNGGSCFNREGFTTFPEAGDPVQEHYNTVGPIDISDYLMTTNTSGVYRLVFNLVDLASTSQNAYGSSEINLVTSCDLVSGYPVCHQNNRNKSRVARGRTPRDGEYKTIYVQTEEDFQSHLNHGDQPGPCSTDTNQ